MPLMHHHARTRTLVLTSCQCPHSPYQETSTSRKDNVEGGPSMNKVFTSSLENIKGEGMKLRF